MIKISQLPDIQPYEGTELAAIVQGGQTRRGAPLFIDSEGRVPYVDDSQAIQDGRLDNLEAKIILPNTYNITKLEDFPTYDATTVTLEASTRYIIHGQLDIGNRVFTVPQGLVYMGGVDPLLDKIISSSSGTLFATTDSDLTIDNLGFNCPNATMFNLVRTTGSSFNFLYNVDMDNVASLGTVVNVNTFAWYGYNFSTRIGNLDLTPALRFSGLNDVVRIENVIAQDWNGEYISFENDNAVEVFELRGCDFKFKISNQRILAADTDNEKMLNEGRVTDNRLRQTPDSQLTDQEWITILTDALGTVDEKSEKWFLDGNNLLRDSEYDFLSDISDYSLTMDQTPINLFALANDPAYGTFEGSQFVYDAATEEVVYTGRRILTTDVAFNLSGFNNQSQTRILIIESTVTSTIGFPPVTVQRRYTLSRSNTMSFNRNMNFTIYPGDRLKSVMYLETDSAVLEFDLINVFINK